MFLQYASSEYVDKLRSHGFLINTAPPGNPYENAMMESFSRHWNTRLRPQAAARYKATRIKVLRSEL